MGFYNELFRDGAMEKSAINYYPTVALDIETECTVEGCSKKCKHALDPFTSRITCVGIYNGSEEHGDNRVFRNLSDLDSFLQSHRNFRFVGHNLKFDLKHLKHHGIEIPLEHWRHDTQLMAAALTTKVEENYLQWYEEHRAIKNKQLPKGYSHRNAKGLSLKVLAPFFLKVEPFWENPVDHDNDEYVLKDCKYTYKLCQMFTSLLIEEGTFDFYENKLLPWAKNLFRLETRGIKIDLDLLEEEQALAERTVDKLQAELDISWAPVYKKFREKQEKNLTIKYGDMECKALLKTKDEIRCRDRYTFLLNEALDQLPIKMNINSPKQVAWIFKDLGYDIKNFWGKETTAKSVLQKLAGLDNCQDVSLYLSYRQQNKLVTSFFPTYKELNRDSIIHCNFNPTGTRTGRLSSREPNLQQVPPSLRRLFVARPGHLLATYDMAAIETILIAYYSEDPILLNIVLNDIDFHGSNAKLYFPEIGCNPNEVKAKYPEERDLAKELGYAFFYGAGPKRILETSRKRGYNWTLLKCKELYDNFKENYKQVFEFKSLIDKKAESEAIKNMFGRAHRFQDFSEIYMKNFNRLIQGSASDMVQESAKRIAEMPWIHVLLLVHDEIVCEIPEDRATAAAEYIEHCMTFYPLKLSKAMREHFNKGAIKLKVEGNIGPCWMK